MDKTPSSNNSPNNSNDTNGDIADLRAHHLYSLASLHLMRVADNELMEDFVRKRRAKRIKKQGYEGADAFNRLIMDTIIQIIRGEIASVRIVDEKDVLCEGCPKNKGNSCRVMGSDFSSEFLSMADHLIAENSNGSIKIGETYSSEYLVANIKKIREALIKAAFKIPGILRFAKIDD